jgi:hypothetical protein
VNGRFDRNSCRTAISRRSSTTSGAPVVDAPVLFVQHLLTGSAASRAGAGLTCSSRPVDRRAGNDGAPARRTSAWTTRRCGPGADGDEPPASRSQRRYPDRSGDDAGCGAWTATCAWSCQGCGFSS